MICCRVFPSGTCRHLLLARKTCRRENTHRLAMKCTTKNSFKISADCHGNVFLNMMEQGRSVTNRGNCWHKNYRGTSVTRRSRDDHERITRRSGGNIYVRFECHAHNKNKQEIETIPFNERSGNDIRPNCIVCLFRFIASADKGHRGCISCSQTQYIMVKSRKILSLLLIFFYFSPSVYGFLEGLYCGEENCYDGK